MLATELIYSFAGVALFALGLRAALLHRSLLGRVLAINVCGAGVFMILVALAYKGPGQVPDAVPQALVLTEHRGGGECNRTGAGTGPQSA